MLAVDRAGLRLQLIANARRFRNADVARPAAPGPRLCGLSADSFIIRSALRKPKRAAIFGRLLGVGTNGLRTQARVRSSRLDDKTVELAVRPRLAGMRGIGVIGDRKTLRGEKHGEGHRQSGEHHGTASSAGFDGGRRMVTAR